MKCNNDCGDLLILGQPMLIFIGMDVEPELPQGIELPDCVPQFAIIPRICPKCGYYDQVQFFTHDEFELYTQNRLTIECKDNGEISIVRKPKMEGAKRNTFKAPEVIEWK